MQRVLIVILFLAVVALALLAVTQFNTGQEAAALARDAQTAQAEILARQATSVGQAATAESERDAAQAAQQTALAQATAAADLAGLADSARETAAAEAAAARQTLAARETDLSAAQDEMATQAALLAQSGTLAGDALATITAQAGALDGVNALLGTATAQVDLAEFAREAAEADRATAVEQAWLAQTAAAHFRATLEGMQPVTPSTTPSPSPTRARTPTPTSVIVTEPVPTLPPAQTGTPVVIGDTVLSETFASPDDAVRLRYPAGWLVQELQGQIFMVNTPDVLATEGPVVQPGHFLVNMLIGPATDLPGLEADPSAEVFLDALVEIINARANVDSQLGVVEMIQIGGYEAARTDGSTPNGQTVLIAVRLGDGLFAIAFGNSAAEELADFEPTLRAILGTLEVSGS